MPDKRESDTEHFTRQAEARRERRTSGDEAWAKTYDHFVLLIRQRRMEGTSRFLIDPDASEK